MAGDIVHLSNLLFGDDSDGTLADSICRTLADEIMSGARALGRCLDEAELAERFAVSRTPIREALRQLATTGLI